MEIESQHIQYSTNTDYSTVVRSSKLKELSCWLPRMLSEFLHSWRLDFLILEFYFFHFQHAGIMTKTPWLLKDLSHFQRKSAHAP